MAASWLDPKARPWRISDLDRGGLSLPQRPHLNDPVGDSARNAGDLFDRFGEVDGLDDGESGNRQVGGHEGTVERFDAGPFGIAYLHRSAGNADESALQAQLGVLLVGSVSYTGSGAVISGLIAVSDRDGMLDLSDCTLQP
jgi:hypothetical protein